MDLKKKKKISKTPPLKLMYFGTTSSWPQHDFMVRPKQHTWTNFLSLMGLDILSELNSLLGVFSGPHTSI
jgi:hypothetical protein